ncbi:MAG: hypothetical protein HQL17_05410 [Candidatus Omnitrophica bacterium]|nr:hypothetical protein [Candidatus Omnitrophota bacterium]
MVKRAVLIMVIYFLGAAFVHAGPPTVTEKPVVPSADGSYAVQDKDAKDEVRVLETAEIAALDDQKILDAYMDVVVELEASKIFHATSGFAPKEYKKYKSLLKYRMLLSVEINRRKLEIPPLLN